MLIRLNLWLTANWISLQGTWYTLRTWKIFGLSDIRYSQFMVSLLPLFSFRNDRIGRPWKVYSTPSDLCFALTVTDAAEIEPAGAARIRHVRHSWVAIVDMYLMLIMY
jgi:hypothetical protein